MTRVNFGNIGRTPRDLVRTRRLIQRLNRVDIEIPEIDLGPGLEVDPDGEIFVNLQGLQTFNEEPAGDVDGVNDTFVTSQVPLTGTTRVFVNGVFMALGDDYTVSDDEITFISEQIPETGDRVRVHYVYANPSAVPPPPPPPPPPPENVTVTAWGDLHIGVATDIPVHVPEETYVGDRLIAYVQSTSNSITPPSGWSLVEQSPFPSVGSAGYSYVYTKVSDGTEGNTTLTFVAGSASPQRSGSQCFTVRHTNTPVVVGSSSAAHTGGSPGFVSGTSVASAATPTGGLVLLGFISVDRNNANNSLTVTAAGWTQLTPTQILPDPGSDALRLRIATGVRASSSPTAYAFGVNFSGTSIGLPSGAFVWLGEAP
jgi:hypothetical protein